MSWLLTIFVTVVLIVAAGPIIALLVRLACMMIVTLPLLAVPAAGFAALAAYGVNGLLVALPLFALFAYIATRFYRENIIGGRDFL